MITKKSGKTYANILLYVNDEFCVRKQICYADFNCVKDECHTVHSLWQRLKERGLLSEESIVSFLVKDNDFNFIPRPTLEETEKYDFVIHFVWVKPSNKDWQDKNCMLVHNQKSREGYALLNLMNDKPEWKISEDFLAA
ncbi:MAG: hypothetical protein J5680_06355 [Neisseriaceae bacterium]|nr:hypothetical protein [Neisseriaceae bacterium]